MDINQTIGFIGAGHMGSCMIERLLKQENTSSICICDHHTDKIKHLLSHPHVSLIDNPKELAELVDVLILAVKPQSIQDVFTNLQGFHTAKQPIIISIIAGLTTKQIRQKLHLEDDYPVIRMMPNTPGLIHAGMTGLYAHKTTASMKITAELIASALGEYVWVNQENLIDAITALSGSGPAYFFMFLEGLIQAGENLGLSSECAKKLALQTGLGAIKMAMTSDDLKQLRQQVTSKGGTTEAGLSVFEKHHLDMILQEVLETAYKRSKELSSGLGE